jgi:NADH dehydrogenase
MTDHPLVAVTGAFGYTGKYITRCLLAAGQTVITLTGSPDRPNEFGGRVRAYPFNFTQLEALSASLEGVHTLYNTYWVRFNYGQTTYDKAVQNTLALIQAARAAGVRRIVHVSITNPSLDSPLPYFRGKALLEQAILSSGLSYAILRPTVLFGLEDILINNIAYLLRRSPVFAIPGSGSYCLQPIFVEDMASLAVFAGASPENLICDTVGPEIFSFNELIRLIAGQLDSRAMILHLPERLALTLSRLVSKIMRDVVLTRDELDGLSRDLLVSSDAPLGQTRFSEWLAMNRDSLGRQYASELARHYRETA